MTRKVTRSLVNAPKGLVVSVNRFEYTTEVDPNRPNDGPTMRVTRINLPYTVSMEITLQTENEGPQNYRLLSLIQHKGSPTSGKHSVEK